MSKRLAIACGVYALGLVACDGSGNNPIVTGLGGTSGANPGGGPGFTGDNVLALVVDPGPPDSTGRPVGYTNGLFATVTLCVPGTTLCNTIEHMLVDTGSVGVRVLESLVTVGLPTATSSSGGDLAGCAPFVDGTAWGPLRRADVQLGNQTAAGLTVHLIGTGSYLMPDGCAGSAITDLDTLGANGILGVGIYVEDCGPACALPASSPANPGVYYSCAAATGTCTVTSVAAAEQVSNPVAALPVDNNGVIIVLPAIPAAGAPSVPGQLLFGIGTQANNGLGSAALVTLDGYGFATTAFPAGGPAYASIVDSGSNGLFFLDSATTGLTQCAGGFRDCYCPSAVTRLDAGLLGPSGGFARVDFTVTDASNLNRAAWAFSNLAGPMPGFPFDSTLPAFDWGLPFFFGRAVFTAIEGRATPGGPGPFLAF
jgi:hypothetical protein